MYKNNNFRSSNRTPQKRYSFKKSSRSGGYNSANRYGGGGGYGRNRRPKSELSGNPAIFIKKAVENSTKVEYTPHNSFSDFNITTPLKVNIMNRGYTTPTPIQDQAIESILEGRDLIGLANTGTGKTAAFLIPLIDKVFRNRAHKTLIIVPTRELAIQINEEFRNFAWDMKIYSALIIGGGNMRRQVSDLRRSPHFVIATPGRLRDLIQQKAIYLEDFDTFVLDEVDLMVDIGFIHDIKYFISLLPIPRQSLFFSATISPKVKEILHNFVNDPVTISVKVQDTAENVDQDVVKVLDPTKKVDQLHDLLIKDGFSKVLIFGRTKHGVEKLHRELEFRGFKTGAIHGNKNLSQRKRVLQSFKENEIQVLLATDVASRGLDIEDVTHVINYEIPETYDDYVHRIGRTGRAGKTGIALTFVD